MNRAAVLLVFFCANILLDRPDATLFAKAAAANQKEGPRLLLRCGPNALYLLLKSHGLSPDFQQLEHQLTIMDRGVSMLDLQRTAANMGLECEVRRITAMELSDSVLPCLAYFPKPFPSSETGHFVLVYKIVEEGDDRGIWVIEPTAGIQKRFRREKFFDLWSGHILQPRRSSGLAPIVLWVLILVSWTGLACSLSTPVLGYYARRLFVAVMFGSLFACSPPATVAGQLPLAGDDNCRNQSFDGENSLYLFLRAHGTTVSYQEIAGKTAALRRASGSLSLDDVAKTGRVFAPIVVRRVGPMHVRELTLPLITHRTNDGTALGSFDLIVSYPDHNDGKVVLVRGGTGQLTELTVDDFLRSWSGLVLTVDRDRQWWPIPLGTNAGIVGLFLVACLLQMRARDNQNVHGG